jgi:hypothetical protein
MSPEIGSPRDRDRGKGAPDKAKGTPKRSGALSSEVPASAGASVGELPPPPAGGPKAEKGFKSVTPGQLGYIKAIKANPEAREQWFAALEQAVKDKEIKVPTIVQTLKTKPESLSIGSAKIVLSYAPLLDPQGPATADQMDRVAGAYGHALKSETLRNEYKTKMPDLYEKVESSTELTKEEASRFIAVEADYNKAIAKRPATPEQIAAVKQMLANDPELGPRMSETWHKYLADGNLNHAGVQKVIDEARELRIERNEAHIDAVMPALREMDSEQLGAVINAYMPRLEEKVGKPFSEKAANFVSNQIKALADPNADGKKLDRAMNYFCQFENAKVLRDVVEAQ